MAHVQFHPDQCLVNLSPMSQCAACASVCPADAIVRAPRAKGAGEDVTLDSLRCTSCMLCRPVCPGDAFVPRPWPESFTTSPRILRLQCSRGEEQAFDETGNLLRLPCLDGLGWWDLLRFYLGGTREMLYAARDACVACPSGSQPRFLAAVTALNQVLAAAGLEPLRCQQVAPDILLAQGQSARETPGWSRRGLLSGTLFRSAEAIMAPALTARRDDGQQQEMQRSRVELLRQLSQLAPRPHLAAYDIALDSASCYACHACLLLCPSGALQIEQVGDETPSTKSADGEQALYMLQPEFCIGCELCQDVCDVDAIRVDWNPSERSETQLSLYRHQCAICSLEYLSLTQHEQVCWVCRILEERKRQFGNVSWIGLNEDEGAW